MISYEFINLTLQRIFKSSSFLESTMPLLREQQMYT